MLQARIGDKPVMIVGHENISAKLLGACLEVINFANDGDRLVNEVIFTEDPEMTTIGLCNVKTGQIVVNVREILDQELGMPLQKRCLSLRGEYVLQVIETLAHECGHIDHYVRDPNFLLQTGEAKEAFASDFGFNMLMAIVEKFDIEPVALAEEPYLMRRLSELFITRGGDELFRRERRLILQGVVYEDPIGNRISTLREFMHRRFRDGQEWRQSTFPVRIEFNANEKGESKVYEPEITMAVAGDEITFEDDAPIGIEDVPGDGGYYEADGGADAEVYEPVVETAPPVAPAVVPSVAVAPTTMKPEEVPIMTTGLKIPAHIAAAMQANTQGAAAVAAPQGKPAPRMLPPNNYPAEQLKAFMNKVYERLYHHIFSECGWTGTQAAGATDWHFENAPAVIAKPVNISDLIHQFGMPDVIVAYNTHDAMGRKQYGPWAEKCTNGLVRGEVFKNTGLPAYTLYCNFYGNEYVRKLIPQNLAKDSPYGARARNGEVIAWAIKEEGDGTFTTLADGTKKANGTFLGHFANGVWVPAANK